MLNKRGEETRRFIRQCACSLFAEKGFKRVTMKDICEAADLSRGGLYGHYESTHQIFGEIINDLMNRQEDEIDWKIKQNQSAIVILDDVLERYQREMLDSKSSLSLAIYEYFSIKEIAEQKNALYEQYLMSAGAWEKLIQYGMDRKEFQDVDSSAVFHLIVFSYQGVRMYSKLMPIDGTIPEGITEQIKKILVGGNSHGNHFS